MSGERTPLQVLLSIEALLQRLVAVAGSGARPQASAATTGTVAPDRDLDGKYGNPIIKAKDPRDWTGPTMKGRRFSDCPADYLDLVAARLDYFADQAEAEGKLTTNGKPVAPYNRADAARARGWAKRIRSGVHTPGAVSSGPPDEDWGPPPSDDDIPFVWLLPLLSLSALHHALVFA